MILGLTAELDNHRARAESHKARTSIREEDDGPHAGRLRWRRLAGSKGSGQLLEQTDNLEQDNEVEDIHV